MGNPYELIDYRCHNLGVCGHRHCVVANAVAIRAGDYVVAARPSCDHLAWLGFDFGWG